MTVVHRAARSPEELALVRVVAADNTDPVALSVYADFLQDQNDPRGDFLREFARAYAGRKTLPMFTPELPAAWIDALGLRSRRKVRHARNGPAFGPVFDLHMKAARPCVRFTLGEDRPDLDWPLGATRAGGLPDMPPGSEWPPTDEFGNPTPFLFQLDLAELRGTFAEGTLPGEGLLVVFGCPDAYTRGGRMFFYPPGTPLARLSVPVAVFERFPRAHARQRPLTLADSLYYRGANVPDHLREADRFAGEVLTESDGNILCPTLSDAEAAGVPGSDAHPQDYPLLLRVYDDDEMDWEFGDGSPMSIYASREQARAGDFRQAYHWTD